MGKDDIAKEELIDITDPSALEEPEDDGLMPADGALSELDALRAERDDMRDRFMRTLADAENSRKRGERDRKEAEQYGGSKLARDMLPVYD
ncbi:MAG: nucleotide exchange factor GrpE, partial [Deltaproteobacteria bacterium]